MRLKKFIAECRDKEVLKNLSIYIVSSWVLLQVVALFTEPLGLPEISLTYLLIILLAGFPLYIYLLWRYILADKIEKKPLLDQTGKPVPGKFSRSPFQKIYFSFLTLITIVAVGILLAVIDKKFVHKTFLPDLKADNKIAVLKFDNNTGDIKYDIAGKMAVDWIIHGITENKVAQVISPEIIEDYSTVLKASIVPSLNTEKSAVVTDYLKPSKIISGEYYLNKNRLLFQCSIKDEIMNKTLISFKPVECEPDAPLDCIESLKQRILGYLITEDYKLLNLQESPPNYNAYQYLIEAKAFQDIDDAEHLRLLDKAIEADSTFFEPYTYKVLYYYNSDQYKIADSLLQGLATKVGNNKRLRNLLDVYEALFTGNNRNVYKYLLQEYNLTPFDLETNGSMMTIALQFVNKPKEIDSIFTEVNMEAMNLENCVFCENRFYIKGLADIELKKYDQAIGLLTPFAKQSDHNPLKKVLLKAHIKSGNNEVVDTLLANFGLISQANEWMEVSLFAAKEFLVKGDKASANLILEKIINSISDSKEGHKLKELQLLAESLFFNENYQQAENVLEELLQLDSGLISYSGLLAVVYQKNGKLSEAQKQIDALDQMRADYQFGSVDYALARYYASLSDEEQALGYLLKAVAAGRWYAPDSFQNDPFFTDYLETNTFQRIMNFWG